ncbi:putative bifunctional diguanylate cyclase/phosphodiesterase [Candidatus Thiodiazotropha sp. CDECU1]|uniref:putative bifunctional diguanylate cyclase/phosphodiesterase n=1 Tax=Candidatus Thiodiazotropha sp. CDECU1 TaxID=3065865 RepID=UPI00292EF2D4|nr:EAL domain-containing protein [Candidatus Thiodiazotropha sp. CDECU1]
MGGVSKSTNVTETGSVAASADLSNRLLSQALEQTADIVLITDSQGVIEYVNPAFEQTTGYSSNEAVGERPSLLCSGIHDKAFYRQLWSTIANGQVFRGVVVNQRKDGSYYHEEKTITPLIGENGDLTHFVSTGKDVTERVRVQQQLHELAYFDALTELPNWRYLQQLLAQAVHQAKRHNDTLAVLFLDLDQFKRVNDALGHAKGDQLLREVAHRLRATLREEDTVGRSGGDEFVVLIHQPQKIEDLVRVAEKLLKQLTQPFVLNGQEHRIGISIGISVYPQDQQTPGDLLKAADMAMYRAKSDGDSRYRFFSRDMETEVVDRIRLEQCLRQGLVRHELLNFYQPQYDLSNGRLTGTEALVRWHHPVHGIIGPDRFIPVAEETGDIIDIGNWVLTEACQQIADWTTEGLPIKQMSVNLSPRQLAHPDIVNQVSRLISEHSFLTGKLVLELTESSLMQHPDQAALTLASLKDLGVKLSVDDFGTGYSSLSYLRRFPLDCVKIDRCFVKDMEIDKAATALVEGIVRLAHSLNMSVVAEGVETETQLDMLSQMGCEAAQGYLLGRPMPPNELHCHSIKEATASDPVSSCGLRRDHVDL